MISFSGKYLNLTIKPFLRNKRFLEITVFLFTILLAAFLGNYIALLATRQITDMLTRFFAGVLIGLVIGIVVGILVKRTWEKIQPYFFKVESQ